MATSPGNEITQTTTTSNKAAKNICTHVITVRAEQLFTRWSTILYTSRTRHDIEKLIQLTFMSANAANNQSISWKQRMQGCT